MLSWSLVGAAARSWWADVVASGMVKTFDCTLPYSNYLDEEEREEGIIEQHIKDYLH